MRAFDRKLLRDLARMKGQVLAIALVVAGGVALFVLMLGTLQSLEVTRDAYYDRYRFADVFAQVKRAPQALTGRISEIPGVQAVQTRIVADVTLDIAGMMEPAIGRLISLPEHDAPSLNALALRQGRAIAPGRPFEAIASEAFAEAHGLRARRCGQRHHQPAAPAVRDRRHRAVAGVCLLDGPRRAVPRRPHVRRPVGAPADACRGLRPRGCLQLGDAAAAARRIRTLGHRRTRPVARAIRTLGAQGRDDQLSHWFLNSELDQLWALVRIAPPIFLLVAAFLLNIAITRMIDTERTQIGLLKAFGFSNLAVGWHYGKFVLAVVALGVLIGFGWAPGSAAA
jgi:putative ABC transport system permease protein